MVDVARIADVVERRPTFLARILTEREQELAVTPASIAGRWAAKEAVAKVFIDTRGLAWHDCEILRGDRGEPVIVVTGSVEQAARDRGIAHWHLSISHDGGMAVAFVVASRAVAS